MVNLLTALKEFLADRTTFAFLAVSLATNAVLFRLYVKEKDAHLATVLAWLPLADKLVHMLSAVAERARNKRASRPTQE